MTLKNYIFAMTVLTIVCWVLFSFVVGIVDPFNTNWIGFLLFYLTLFVSLIGTASILGLVLRFYFSKNEPIFNLVKNSFRQSFLIASFLTIALVLKAQGYFSWINIILLVIIFTILEFFLREKKTNN